MGVSIFRDPISGILGVSAGRTTIHSWYFDDFLKYQTFKIANQPVVFIHGNSDGALADGSKYGTGWTKSIEYFTGKGYSKSELYATVGNMRHR